MKGKETGNVEKLNEKNEGWERERKEVTRKS